MNTNLSNPKFVKKINLCPLCNKKKRSKYNKTYYTRYTDEISKALNVSGTLLMQTIKNFKCDNCGLLYKKNWFTRNALNQIFPKNVPNHPTGWDKISNKFSKKYLKMLIIKLKSYLRKNDLKNIEKVRILLRTIRSVVFSMKIKKQNEKKIRDNFVFTLDKMHKENFKYPKFKKNLDSINKYQEKIVSILNEPRKYSRFKGFEDEKLFDFIENKIGKIYNYAEIGCPLWGMLKMAQNKGCKTFFIKPDYSFFWGKNCKKNGVKCSSKVSNFSEVTKLNNNKHKFDFLGAYAVLDHYDDFYAILKKIFSTSKSLGIISENNEAKIKKDKGMPIQHCFGLNEKSANYIAKRFNKKLDSSFKDIQISQYKFYLFY
jgi:hypothetical protein|tara:strand:+ start:507 stop:1622 length:1116 start_codon:yes stop_codon:yes gene_type:complete